MTHYDESKWIDFVRDLVSSRERQRMQTHLDGGCRRCNRSARLLAGAAAVAASDSRWTVPEGAQETAKAIFALRQPDKVHILPRVVARLVYDSFRDPLPAGVRMQHRMTRQALYEAGPYSVDVRLEHERGSGLVLMVGQIASRNRPQSGLGDLAVLLMSGKAVVAKTASNQFGEFQMEYRPARRLRLYVTPVEGKGKAIEVPLNGLRPDSN